MRFPSFPSALSLAGGCAAACLSMVPAFGADPMAGYPVLRPGVWETTRKPLNAPPNLPPFKSRECTDPRKTLFMQSRELEMMGCKILPPKQAGKTYSFSSTCDIPKTGKTRSRSLLIRDSDSAYTLNIQTEGEMNGKPVNATDVITARRIGDCKTPK